MATFIVVPPERNSAIDAKLKNFGNKALQLPQGEWLVSYEGTSMQLSHEIGITDENDRGETIGTAIVLNFSAYWGRSSKNIWEWMNEHGA